MIKLKNCCRTANNILLVTWILSILFYFPICIVIDKIIPHDFRKIAYIFYAALNSILLIYCFCSIFSFFKRNENKIIYVFCVLFLFINICILFLFILSLIYGSWICAQLENVLIFNYTLNIIDKKDSPSFNMKGGRFYSLHTKTSLLLLHLRNY